MHFAAVARAIAAVFFGGMVEFVRSSTDAGVGGRREALRFGGVGRTARTDFFRQGLAPGKEISDYSDPPSDSTVVGH